MLEAAPAGDVPPNFIAAGDDEAMSSVPRGRYVSPQHRPSIVDDIMQRADTIGTAVIVPPGEATAAGMATRPVIVQQESSAVGDSLVPSPPTLSAGCFPSAALFMLYVTLIFALALLTLIQREVGLFFLTSAPSVCFLGYVVYRYREVIDVVQLIFTTLWAICLMAPLVVLGTLVIEAFVAVRFFTFSPWLEPFITAYLIAGLLEEALKYNAIRAILWKDLVADPRSLLVYACGAANGFAIVENFLYVFLSNSAVATGIARAFLSVPAHTAWGMLSGSGLAARKFLGKDNSALTILPAPVLLHGTYNFFLFAIRLLPPSAPWYAPFLLQLGSLMTTIFSIALVWLLSRPFKHVPFVEVRTLQRAGLLPKATVSSCVGDLARCFPCTERTGSQEGRLREARELQSIEEQYRLANRARVASTTEALGYVTPGIGTVPPQQRQPTSAMASGAPVPPVEQRYMRVRVPDGFTRGQRLRVRGPLDGREYTIDVPPNVEAGSNLVIAYQH